MWDWIRRFLTRSPTTLGTIREVEVPIHLDNSDIDREWDDLGRIRQRLDFLIHADNGRHGRTASH